METTIKKAAKINQSITLKALIIGFLTLILLIPGLMIQDLIRERQNRSLETIEKINNKWSNAQTFCGPVISIPYTTTQVNPDNKTTIQEHLLNITPENLNITTQLFPEERYYGIYKTILYKSEIDITGNFDKINFPKPENSIIHWEQAYLSIGVSDLRGITENIDFKLDNKQLSVEATGNLDTQIGKMLVMPLKNTDPLLFSQPQTFNCKLKLNGSSNINFIPIGKTTKVHVTGNWKSPGFIGNFSPEHHITEKGFEADWSILSFNRSIPEMWIDYPGNSFDDSSFGVSLIDPVNHYQQNMRSAKYAIMFIALTFVALGTSLPELVTAITSLVKGHSALSLGNIVGANLFNLVLVSGLSTTLSPFQVPQEKTIAGHNASLVVDIPLMMLVMLLLTVPALARGRLSRWQGIVLLVLYAGFCAFQFCF